MVKQISDNEIYLLIKYIKSVLWSVAKRLSYKQDARYLKVNVHNFLLDIADVTLTLFFSEIWVFYILESLFSQFSIF